LKKPRSIKWKLIFLFTSVSTLPVIFLGTLLIYFSAKGLENEINAKNLLLSKIFINQAEKYLEQPLADLEVIKRYLSSEGTINTTSILFEELLERHNYIVKFVITDREGYVTGVFPKDQDLLGSDLSRRAFFRNLRENGGRYWSSVFISSPDNIPVTALSVPLEYGVLTAHLNLSMLSEIANELSETKDIVVSVTDQTGTYIAHSNYAKVLQRDVAFNYNQLRAQNVEGIIKQDMMHDGKDFVCHIGFIRQTGWSIMISQPYEKTYSPVKRLLWGTLSLTLLLFIFSFVVSYRYGAAIKNTIDLFLVKTRKIAGGQYDTEISDVKYSEFIELSSAIYGMAQKIDQREKDILDSQAMFRAVFDADAVGTCIMDRKLRFQTVNAKWSEITGYAPEDLIDQTILTLTHADDRDEFEKNLQAIIEGRKTSGRQEKRMVRKDGCEIRVDHTMAVIKKGRDIEYLVGMIVDNTEKIFAREEKEQLEKKLQQAYKMEAVGSLASGIAHDFNNILAAILGYAEMSIADTDPNSEVALYLEEIEKAGNRASDLVKQILAFSRQAEFELTRISPVKIVNDTMKMLRPSIPASIDISTDIEPGLGYIRANPTQIHQVIVNLCTNSFQAMEETGGVLKIILQKKTLGVNDLHHVPHVSPGEFVVMTIKDNGPGIPENVKRKIFDPYFTTKEFGKGTGMGLSIVHGTMTKHGGFVALDEHQSTGASFSVFLPLIDGESEESVSDSQAELSGEGNILMVDDEVMLTDLGRRKLESLGYEVSCCNSSLEALEMFKKDPAAFDLVITDQTMPKMSGLELVARLHQIRSGVPVVLCTGYSSTVAREDALSAGVNEFVLKPYNYKDLSVIIRKVLKKG